MERLIKEAQFLAEGGVKELTLIAQETTVYGVDLYGKKMLPELLDRLCEIEGIEWIRLLYCYPEEITDELIETMKRQPKICHYLDMPIQHAADTVLKRMGRRTTHKELNDLIAKLRREIPDIALRTSLITGFPQETEEEHQELLEFVKETGFERLGAGTPSCFSGLFCYGLVREDLDPNLTTTLDITCHSDTGCFDLSGCDPCRFECL